MSIGSKLTISPRLPFGIHSDTFDCMNTFQRSDEFDAWLAALKDRLGRARKSSQKRDIKRAIEMARALDKE
jgi:putative component of toxin-antitoxin plasmid stabilization module